MAAVNFTGKWRENRSENKEAMMRKLGVPEENVSKWAAFKITMDITHEGDKFYMKTLGMYFMFAPLMVHGFRILFFFQIFRTT